MLSNTRGILVAVVLLTGFAGSAYAQSTAEELIIAGVQLREQGRDEEALELFRQAHAAEPSGRTLAQMALAEQALGSWIDAYTHLTEALSRDSEEWIQRNREALQAAVATIEQNIGRLDLRGGVPGAQVLVNGQPMGTMPLTAPITVRVGTVQLTVRAPGYIPVQRSIVVNAGSLTRETIDLAPDPNGGSDDPEDPGTTSSSSGGSASSGGGSSPVPWILVGTGGAMALAGVIPYALTFGKAAEYNDDDVCLADGLSRDENCGDIADQITTLNIISGVLVGVGVATAGVGLVLHFVMDDDGTETQSAGLSCGGGPGEIGASCTLQW